MKFEEWLLPRSRTLLVGLVAANFCFALLNISQEPSSLVETPALAALGPEIQLLAEVPATKTPKAAPRECRLWGPENDPGVFDDLIVKLDATGGFPEVQVLEIQGAPDYLVYIGELASQDNAKRVARELNSLEVDSYLISRERAAPILSVGVFSRKALADKQVEKVSGLGYEVFVEQLERAQTVYNLAAHVSADSDLYKNSTSNCMAFAHNN